MDSEHDPNDPNLTPAALFSKLKLKHPSTVVFTLSPKTILPLYILSNQTDNEGTICHRLYNDVFYRVFIGHHIFTIF